MRISSRFPVTDLAARLMASACLVLFLTQASWAAEAKYVFLFIGDGMSVSQASAAEMYKAALKGETRAGVEKLNFSTFPAQGMTTTYSSESLITDSAAAGTAIACGVKTYNAAIELCLQVKDGGSRELLEKILVESEEHVDWLETQLGLIDQVGLQNYLQSQMGDEPEGGH